MSKYEGIDERLIKCCDPSETTIEAGISFDELENGQNVLCFHFLEYVTFKGRTGLTQKTRTMYLDKENTNQLISELKKIKFKK